MTRELLVRGMLVGLIAGLLSFGFLKVFGEPQVDRAIAFESQMEEARAQAAAAAERAIGHAVATEQPEPELVSRPVQAGVGLLTGVAVYSAAFGGLFALAFALLYGRMGKFGPRTTSALLGAAGFVAVYLVPNLKYPANPPSVGEPETIQIRTTLYFAMIVISILAMLGSVTLRHRLVARHGAWNASLIAGALYLAALVLAGIALPGVNEVPEQFPAVVLWQFRTASIGAQLILWMTLGLGFGALAERVTFGRRRVAFSTAAS